LCKYSQSELLTCGKLRSFNVESKFEESSK
jgi:hypothetical protein